MTTKKCPRCAEEVQEAAKVCRYCDYEFEYTVSPQEVAIVKKGKVLDEAITMYVNQGWILMNRNNDIAQLRKPKQFNWIAFGFWLIVGFIAIALPAILYLIYYAVKKDQFMTLSVNDQGEILFNGVRTTPPAVTTTTQVATSQLSEGAPKTNYRTLWILIAVAGAVFALILSCCFCSYLVPLLNAGNSY